MSGNENGSFRKFRGKRHGAIGEIVRILEADPKTDWSKVNLEALRQHLIDMNEVALHADAAVELLALLRRHCGDRISGFELFSRNCLEMVVRQIPGTRDLAGNAMTFAAALTQHWSVTPILWIFWCQSVIIGAVNVVRILSLKEFSTAGLTMNGRPDGETDTRALRPRSTHAVTGAL